MIDRTQDGQFLLPLLMESPERRAVLEREKQAQGAGDHELARFLGWERGIMDLVVTASDVSTFFRGDPQRYAEFYGFTEETREYAVQRSRETANPALRIHHLEYALRTIEPRGREWVDLRRVTAAAYREFINSVLDHMTPDNEGHPAVTIERTLSRVEELISGRGILPHEEQREWLAWMLAVADRLRHFPWPETDYNRPHRWPFEVVKHLRAIEPSNIGPEQREAALRHVSEAAAFFGAEPLADSFAIKVAEVDHELRVHFGEAGTHEKKTRSMYKALVRKATFFADKGNNLGAQAMFRQARKLADEQGQYFSAADRGDLDRREREAIERAVAAGDFKEVRVTLEIDPAVLDLTKGTAHETIAAFIDGALERVPDYRDVVRSEQEGEPGLGRIISATTIDRKKVVNEALTNEQHIEADVRQRLLLHARLLGRAVTNTLEKARKQLGLTPDHLLAPLRELPIDDDAAQIIGRALERHFAGDEVSAVHILAPQFENAVRSVLRSLGFDTTAFRVVDGETGSSRTDDATLGALLRLARDDRGTAEDVLGTDLWQLIDVTMTAPAGINLRNRVGHGLARMDDCTAEQVGVLLHLFFCLIAVFRKAKVVPGAVDNETHRE